MKVSLRSPYDSDFNILYNPVLYKALLKTVVVKDSISAANLLNSGTESS